MYESKFNELLPSVSININLIMCFFLQSHFLNINKSLFNVFFKYIIGAKKIYYIKYKNKIFYYKRIHVEEQTPFSSTMCI